MRPWKKSEGPNGVPIYIDETSKKQQWNHPKFMDIQDQLNDCNYIKYSSYRVAMKFRVLQQNLFMDHVPLTVIAGVFERHKLGANENSLSLDCYDLEAILFDIYFACNKRKETNVDVEESTELILNLLLNVYDKDRTGKIQVLSSKILLGILSCSCLSDLYRFIFELCSDHNNCVTRMKLQILLKKVTEIVNFLHEDASFGRHLITSATDDCFIDSPGLVGITESPFISWLENGPAILSWLPILSRIKSAENVLHQLPCSCCKVQPFIGLRYKCLKCHSYNQCQRCFLTCKTTNSHKLSHAMREFSSEGNGKDKSNIFFKKLLHILHCPMKKIQKSNTRICQTTLTDINAANPDDDLDTDTTVASPVNELHSVIRQLEQQNRELKAILNTEKHSDKIKLYLETHRVKVSSQINKLKILRDQLKLPVENLPPNHNFQSTPMVQNGKPSKINMDIGVLSPIYQTERNSNYYTDQEIPIPSTSRNNLTFDVHCGHDEASTLQYSFNDISSWIADDPSKYQDFFNNETSILTGHKVHTELDDALAKLQQILANNFNLDESLAKYDNGLLKNAVSEVEGMLTSFIDTVETTQRNSLRKGKSNTVLMRSS